MRGFSPRQKSKGGIKMMKYIIDTKTNAKLFIILKEDGKEFCKISKKANTLEDVKRFIGTMNIKEVI